MFNIITLSLIKVLAFELFRLLRYRIITYIKDIIFNISNIGYS